MVSYSHPPIASSLQEFARPRCKKTVPALAALFKGKPAFGEGTKGLSHELAAMQLVVSLEFKEDLIW